MREIEKKTFEELANSGEFESMDIKLAQELKHNVEGQLAMKIQMAEEKVMEKGAFLKGRQIVKMINSYMEVSKIEGGLLDFEDFILVTVRGENVTRFLNDWDKAYAKLRVESRPTPDQLEILFRRQIQQVHDLEKTLDLYELTINQQSMPRTYDRLREMVDQHQLTRHKDRWIQERKSQVKAHSWAAASLSGKRSKSGHKQGQKQRRRT